MSKQVQRRRGTAVEHNTFTGANGEVTVDTTNKTLRVHDGSTAGGTKSFQELKDDLADRANGKGFDLLPVVTTQAQLEALSNTRVQLGALTVSSNVTVPTGVKLIVTPDTLLTLTSGAVLTLTDPPEAKPTDEWIDAGGDYVVTGGIASFDDFDSGSIEGGRIVFPVDTVIYANWYLPGATQTTGLSDIGDAWNTMAHGFRQQITAGNALTYPSLGITGRHTQTVPMDFTNIQNGNTIEPVHVFCDTYCKYSPHSGMPTFPALDLTASRHIDFRGVWGIEGDPNNVPAVGVLLARNDTGTTHSNRHFLDVFRLDGNFSVVGMAVRQGEINGGASIHLRNNEDDPTATFALIDENVAGVTSRYQTLRTTDISFNGARTWANMTLWAQGADTYTSNVPDSQACLIQGDVAYVAFESLYINSTVTHMTVKPGSGDQILGIRAEGLNFHPQANLTPSNPDVGMCFDLSANSSSRVDGSFFYINRDASDVESVRIVGPGQMNECTLRLGTGVNNPVKAYGSPTLRGLRIISEGTADIDLSNATSVSGEIWVRDESINVTLPAASSVKIRYLRPSADHPLETRNREILWFTGDVTQGAITTLVGPSSDIEYYTQLRGGAIVGATAELDANISAGSITAISVRTVDNTGSPSGLASFNTDGNFTNRRYTNNRSRELAASKFSAGDGLQCRVTSDGTMAGPTKIAVGIVIETD